MNGSSLMGVGYMRYVPALACDTGLARGGEADLQASLASWGEKRAGAAGSSAPSSRLSLISGQ